jgi:hypothetical protein
VVSVKDVLLGVMVVVVVVVVVAAAGEGGGLGAGTRIIDILEKAAHVEALFVSGGECFSCCIWLLSLLL